MLPQGFLGTRADLLMDLVIISLVLIVPALAVARSLARGGKYNAHKGLMLTLASALGVAVLLFEIDLRMSGGIFALTAGSAYAGSGFLNGSIYLHTALSVSTSVLWITLIGLSLWRFPKPPVPGDFSRVHRLLGRAAMLGMLLTAITGVELYIFGFAL